MSSANVLPSASPEEPLYPVLTAAPAENFCLQKIDDIAKTLDQEVGHYRLVAKKYKRAKKFVNWSAAGSSVLSAVFSSASFGSALSVSRKLEVKIKKHREITTLALAKRDTINRLLSKALNNNAVSSHEFDIILSEFEQYNVLKEQVQAKLLRQPSNRKIVDVGKLEKDIRGRVEAKLIKKITNPTASN